MRRKRAERQEAVAGGRVTPADVQQVEFRLAFRGYSERDVDAFLDRVTEDLAFYLEENQRLRASTGSQGRDDVQPTGDDADQTLARAREQAAAIVRGAEQEAAAIRAAGAPWSGQPRSAVAPFLNKEREFLQGLGSLVQTHAEEIREMVLAIRARTESHEAESRDATHAAEHPQPAMGPEPASSAEIRQRLGEPGPEPARGEEKEQDVDRVVVDATEPIYSPEGAQAGEGRERSLRELFWGDE